MKKVIYPGSVDIGRPTKTPLFCKIEYTGSKLSISGVIGPKSNGDAWGGCGQIEMEFKHRNPAHNDSRTHELITPESMEFAAGWNADTWLEFLEVWHLYHLNDMKPECEHQRAAGWPQMAAETIRTYQWRLKPDVSDEKKRLEDEALERARSVEEGRSLGFKAPERRIMALEQFIKTSEPELSGELARWYEATKDTSGYFAHVEEKTRGWINYDEDARGILGKPCETCGYKYGTAWRTVEVPPEIITFLQSLPDASKTPAWV